MDPARRQFQQRRKDESAVMASGMGQREAGPVNHQTGEVDEIEVQGAPAPSVPGITGSLKSGLDVQKRLKDFRRVAALGVDCGDRICIARLGGIGPGWTLPGARNWADDQRAGFHRSDGCAKQARARQVPIREIGAERDEGCLRKHGGVMASHSAAVDAASKNTSPEAPKDCPLCPRLVAYRKTNARAEPTWFNGAAPSFGDAGARLLVVGLAPGRTGANRTGRPFTGDYAGDLLYGTLKKFGFARGEYRADPSDGFTLIDAMITNAVRCAPPENKPTPAEIATCRPFLTARAQTLPSLRVLIALGSIAHESVLRANGLKLTASKFGHGAETALPQERVMISSYHCSRYNTQTRRLTTEMFEDIFARARALLS